MMPRSALGFATGALSCFALAGGAAADTREWGVRGRVEGRSAAVQLGSGLEPTRAASLGGAVELSYGVSFESALTLHLGADALGEVRSPVSAMPQEDGPRALVGEAMRAHGAVGWFYTPSDALTPLLHVQAGATRTSVDARYFQVRTLEGQRRLPPRLNDAARWSPLFSAATGVQWRSSDQRAWAVALEVQWVEAAEVGLSVSWATFGYL